MREGYSRTAEGAALVRALQRVLPRSQRILNDPYASAFIQNPYLRLMAATRVSSWVTSRALDFWAMGGQEFIAIRARFADELATKMAAEGLSQLVLLGAGFDSMALRLQDSLSRVTVFEVDHPATQSVKRKVMEKLGTPDNVRFVAVDFEKDDFVEKLLDAGFAIGASDPHSALRSSKRKPDDDTKPAGEKASSRIGRASAARTLIVWMGVSYYLTAQAMARALAQLATLGKSGVALTFDYVLQNVIDGTTKNRDALAAVRRLAQIGEPWIFGFEPDELPDYLSAFGFTLKNDYGSTDLWRQYCPRSFKPIDYARIAVCERV